MHVRMHSESRSVGRSQLEFRKWAFLLPSSLSLTLSLSLSLSPESPLSPLSPPFLSSAFLVRARGQERDFV